MPRVVVMLLAAAVGGGAGADPIYTDVTAAMGISVPYLGSGAAWSDLDDDGDLDLLVCATPYPYHTYVYRNDGTTFTNVTAGSGISGQVRNFAVGDYDTDGREDVVLISMGYPTTRLMRNVGAMQFVDVSAAAGIGGTYQSRCAWADHDDDGHLDLFTTGTGSFLFHNRGDGTFEERAVAAGLQGNGASCVWFDFDRDGREDCYVGRSGANRLFRNLGDGTFADVAATAGVGDPGSTSGVCAGDVDGDGWFDLYSVNIGGSLNHLYRNLGDGTFADITAASGVGDVGDGRTGTFVDLDRDGLVDIFAANHVYPNRLFRNPGTAGPFANVAVALNVASPGDAFGTACGDFDNDGDVDIFLATHFGNRLLRCDGPATGWLQVHLVGTSSNRSAIGAVVRCVAGGVTTCQHVDGGHGMGDTDSPVLTFGIGDAATAVITVFWPSGLEDHRGDLAANARHELTEPLGTAAPDATADADGSAVLEPLHPNPTTGPTQVSFRLPTAASATISVYDLSGRKVAELLSGTLPTGPGSLIWDGRDHAGRPLPAGTYLLELRVGDRRETRKLVRVS